VDSGACMAAQVRHLYVHIPFCHRICPYCSFHKHTPGGTDMAAFVNAVLAEAARHELRPETIFFGGGTPTMLSETHLETLLRGLHERVEMAGVKEFTVEANPRNIPASKAALLRELGVTRISLGVQAWDAETLRTLGRDHTPEQALEVWEVLRASGFQSLSLDVMFSIPGQTLEAWQHTLETSLRLRPDHLSAYNLNYEEDTEFLRRLRAGVYAEDAERDASFFELGMDLLGAAGFEHYEISNHAQPGHRSLHNEAYWLGHDYLGLGPGAFSTVQGRRWKNIADTASYITRLQQGESVMCEVEQLTEEQRRTERFGLELRTARGLPLELVHDEQRRMLETLREQGLLEVADGFVRLTRQGKPLVDPVAVALMG
jgi:oxygen-independent coproporphyrinogen III oxidase